MTDTANEKKEAALRRALDERPGDPEVYLEAARFEDRCGVVLVAGETLPGPDLCPEIGELVARYPGLLALQRILREAALATTDPDVLLVWQDEAGDLRMTQACRPNLSGKEDLSREPNLRIVPPAEAPPDEFWTPGWYPIEVATKPWWGVRESGWETAARSDDGLHLILKSGSIDKHFGWQQFRGKELTWDAARGAWYTLSNYSMYDTEMDHSVFIRRATREAFLFHNAEHDRF